MTTRNDLPTADECEIRLATKDEQVSMRKLIRPCFSPDLDEQEFIEHCHSINKAEYSQPSRRRGWVLVKRDDPHSPLYAYAETLLRDGWAKDGDGTGIRAAAIYGVMFVITPEQYRRNGYSHRLLQMLHYLLASSAILGSYPSSWSPLPRRPKESFPPADLSYLSSVAPPGFYQKAYIGSASGGDASEVKREGWVSRDTSENSQLSFDLNKLPGSSGQKGKYEIVYEGDLDDLAPEISKAHLKLLQDTPITEGETIYRIMPDSPKHALLFTDLHWVVGCNAGRLPISPTTPIGIRLSSRSDSDSGTETKDDVVPFDSTQPLILFIPHGRQKGELLITLMLNISISNLISSLEILREIGASLDEPCDTIYCWGLDERDELTTKFKELGGEYSYRTEKHYLPSGVAWYGPKGTSCTLDGLEAWAWV